MSAENAAPWRQQKAGIMAFVQSRATQRCAIGDNAVQIAAIV
jgi:hypothetical protein